MRYHRSAIVNSGIKLGKNNKKSSSSSSFSLLAALFDFDRPLEDLTDHNKEILCEIDPLIEGLLVCLVSFSYLLFSFVISCVILNYQKIKNKVLCIRGPYQLYCIAFVVKSHQNEFEFCSCVRAHTNTVSWLRPSQIPLYISIFRGEYTPMALYVPL